MLKVKAIENSGAVGPLMVVLNLSMVVGVLAIVALRFHKLKRNVHLSDKAEVLQSELTMPSHANSSAVDEAGFPAAGAAAFREAGAQPRT